MGEVCPPGPLRVDVPPQAGTSLAWGSWYQRGYAWGKIFNPGMRCISEIMSKMKIEPVDKRGRVVLTKAWRNRLKTNAVVIIDNNDWLEIRAADTDLSRFVDAIEVNENDFGDYYKLRKGLRKNPIY